MAYGYAGVLFWIFVVIIFCKCGSSNGETIVECAAKNWSTCVDMSDMCKKFETCSDNSYASCVTGEVRDAVVLYAGKDELMRTREEKAAFCLYDLPKSIIMDEIEGKYPGGYLNRFVALGCKTYAMEVIDGVGNTKYELHCKGIFLNIRATRVINFNSMLELLKYNRSGHLQVDEPYFIRRDKQKAVLYSVPMSRKLQFTFQKRRVDFDNFETYPLGYKH